MIRLFVRHTVKDYGAWRIHYDQFGDERMRSGVLASSVLRTVGKPNEVTVCHDFENVENAQRFISLDRLRDVMVIAGVAHAPLMWLAEES